MYQWFATMLEGLVGVFNWALAAIQPILDVVGNGISQIGGFLGSAGGLFGGDGEPAAVAPPRGAIASNNRQNLNGEMVVRFENTPPGTRVESGKTNQPGVAMEADVGYRSLAMP